VEPSSNVNAGPSAAAVVNSSYLYSEVLPRSQRVQSPGSRAATSPDRPDAQVDLRTMRK